MVGVLETQQVVIDVEYQLIAVLVLDCALVNPVKPDIEAIELDFWINQD